MDQTIVRPATEDDLPGILEIYNDAIINTTATFDTEPQTLEEKREWLRETSYPYVVLVAERDGQIVGWASLRRFRQKVAYRFTAEDSVYIRADLLGQGIGSLLMKSLMQSAVDNGFRTVIAGIAGDNPASLRLHRQFGFALVGVEREVGYKFERWIDVKWMQKMLGEEAGAGGK